MARCMISLSSGIRSSALRLLSIVSCHRICHFPSPMASSGSSRLSVPQSELSVCGGLEVPVAERLDPAHEPGTLHDVRGERRLRHDCGDVRVKGEWSGNLGVFAPWKLVALSLLRAGRWTSRAIPRLVSGLGIPQAVIRHSRRASKPTELVAARARQPTRLFAPTSVRAARSLERFDLAATTSPCLLAYLHIIATYQLSAQYAHPYLYQAFRCRQPYPPLSLGLIPR